MATISTTAGNYTHTLDVTLSGQSIGGNYSSLHYRYNIHRNVGAGSGSFSLSSPRNFSVNVNGGVNTQSSTFDWRQYADRVFVEGDINVGHDGNGYATPGFSFSFDGFSSAFPATSGSGSVALPRIPKPTTPPGIGTATQTSPTAATVTWSGPADHNGSAPSGYRISFASNSGFSGAAQIDVGNVGSYNVTNLTPGLNYYYRVSAFNAAGQSGWSGTTSALQVAEIGDLDGWTVTGTLPAGLTPVIGTGLRRGSVYTLTGKTGLLREIQSSGSGSVTANAYGLQRTFTGLKAGATYKLQASAVSLQSTVPPANTYRFSVDGIGAGSNLTISATPAAIPAYTFTATATSHVIRLQLNETAAWSGTGWWEANAFYDFSLTEIPNTSPERLQDLVYEGPLSTHYDMACASVGAAWWVDRANVTQFRQVEDAVGVRATFTDKRAPGAYEYTDIAASYDTRNTVNSITVVNHGRDAITGNARDATYTASDSIAITNWGLRPGRADMELRAGYVDLQNLFTDPSFESRTISWPGINSTAAYTTDTATTPIWPASGAWSIRVSAPTNIDSYIVPSGNDAGGIRLGMQAGKTYTVQAQFLNSSLGGTANTLRARRLVAFTRIGSGAYTETYSNQASITTGTRTFLACTFTVPAGASEAFVRFYSGHTSGVCYWDQIMLAEGGNDSVYFDGSSVDAGGNYVYSWAGTPNESVTNRITYKLLNERIKAVIAENKVPERVISSITWNAQEAPAFASTLEVQDRIKVEFRGQTQTSRIVGIKHDISAERWMMTLELVES